MANVAALKVGEAGQYLSKPVAAFRLLHSAAAFDHGEQFTSITKREYGIDEVGVVQALDLPIHKKINVLDKIRPTQNV